MSENDKNLLPKLALTDVIPVVDSALENAIEIQSLPTPVISGIKKQTLAISNELEGSNSDKSTVLREILIIFTKLQSYLSCTQKTLCAFVIIPTFMVLLYNLLIASPMYISDTKFSIQNANTNNSLSIASIFLTGASSTINDSYIVLEYIKSLSLIEKINNNLETYKHYASDDNDSFYRLSNNATKTELLNYWNWVITPVLDTDTGIINLQVKAFNPQMAQKVSLFIIEASEQLVNDMNERSHEDSLFLARQEVERAELRVKAAQVDIRKFRDTHIILDPIATASGLQALVAQLESEYVQLSTRLNEARSFMKENSPTVKNLQTSLVAVEKQLNEEKNRLAGNSFQNTNLTAVVGDYEDLTLETEFAREQLITAMTALESARIQQVAQLRYLIPIQPPILADESLYPKPFVFALYTFLGLLLALALVSLIVVAIREHTGF